MGQDLSTLVTPEPDPPVAATATATTAATAKQPAEADRASKSIAKPGTTITTLAAKSTSFSVSSRKKNNGKPRMNVALLHETLGSSSSSRSSRRKAHVFNKEENSILLTSTEDTPAGSLALKSVNDKYTVQDEEDKESEKPVKNFAKEREVEVMYEHENQKLKFQCGSDGSIVSQKDLESATLEDNLNTPSLLSEHTDKTDRTDMAQCPADATATSRDRRLYLRRLYEEQQSIERMALIREMINAEQQNKTMDSQSEEASATSKAKSVGAKSQGEISLDMIERARSDKDGNVEFTLSMLGSGSMRLRESLFSVESSKDSASQSSRAAGASQGDEEIFLKPTCSTGTPKSKQTLNAEDDWDTTISAKSARSDKSNKSAMSAKSASSDKSHTSVMSAKSAGSDKSHTSAVSVRSEKSIKSSTSVASARSDKSIKSTTSAISAKSDKSNKSTTSAISYKSDKSNKSAISPISPKSAISPRSVKPSTSATSPKSVKSSKSAMSPQSVKSSKSAASAKSVRSIIKSPTSAEPDWDSYGSVAMRSGPESSTGTSTTSIKSKCSAKRAPAEDASAASPVSQEEASDQRSNTSVKSTRSCRSYQMKSISWSLTDDAVDKCKSESDLENAKVMAAPELKPLKLQEDIKEEDKESIESIEELENVDESAEDDGEEVDNQEDDKDAVESVSSGSQDPSGIVRASTDDPALLPTPKTSMGDDESKKASNKKVVDSPTGKSKRSGKSHREEGTMMSKSTMESRDQFSNSIDRFYHNSKKDSPRLSTFATTDVKKNLSPRSAEVHDAASLSDSTIATNENFHDLYTKELKQNLSPKDSKYVKNTNACELESHDSSESDDDSSSSEEETSSDEETVADDDMAIVEESSNQSLKKDKKKDDSTLEESLSSTDTETNVTGLQSRPSPNLRISVDEPSYPSPRAHHASPRAHRPSPRAHESPASIFERLDQPASRAFEDDGEVDVRFVEQYENLFQEFLYMKPQLMQRDFELLGFLKVVKLQKILEASSDMEKNLKRSMEIVERQKTFMSKAYHSQLMEASQVKAQHELKLQHELETVTKERKAMEARLTWERIMATQVRARRQQRILADLAQRKANGDSILAFIPHVPETQLLRATLTTSSDKDLPEELQRDIPRFQVDNAFFHAETLIRERQIQSLFSDAKKHAWVDAIFMQMNKDHMKKLKALYEAKMAVKL